MPIRRHLQLRSIVIVPKMDHCESRGSGDETKPSAPASPSFSFIALPLLLTNNEKGHSSSSTQLMTQLSNCTISTFSPPFSRNPPQNWFQISSIASLASSLPPADLKVTGKIHHAGGGQHSLGTNLTDANSSLRTQFDGLVRQFRKALKQRFAERKSDDLSSQNTATTAMRGPSSKVVETSQHLLAGATAAMVSRTLVAPLERVKLEYLLRGAKSDLLKTIRNILLAEGVMGFWKGNGVNLLRTAPFKSINFYAYDAYRSHLLRSGSRTDVSNVERLAAGAAAGITATILCFPLDTLRTVIVAPGGETLGGLGACFQHVMQTEGVLGLYKGLLPAVISMAPSGAIFYGVYDILKSSYLNSSDGRAMTRRNRGQLEVGPTRTLLFGALAGAVSETVTYPLEVVRRAQQLQHGANHLSMVGTIHNLLSKGGVGALYAGLLPSTAQVTLSRTYKP